MKSKNTAYLVGAIAAVLVVFACAASALGFGYFAFRDQIAAVFAGPQEAQPTSGAIVQEDSPTLEPTSTLENQAELGSEADLGTLFLPVWEARGFLHDNFVEQPVSDEVLADGALAGLTAYLDERSISLGAISVPDDAPSADSLAEEAGTPPDAQDAFAPFWEAWRKVQFGDGDVRGTYEDLMRFSLGGMVDALGDPHTSYLDPLELQQSQMSLEGEYEGIGAWVDTTTEYVTIIAPMEGSPAEDAGLQPGDMVIAVDGNDLTGVPGEVVITYILGPAGTPVVLTIQREGEPTPFDVEVIREHIVVPSVESELIEGDIAYVQLFTFGADSAEELHIVLEDLLAQNPSGLILDLRNNGGGYLHTAVEITSEFLEDGLALIEEYGDGSRDEYEVDGSGVATEIPLVVLVNGGTASASEILAGAIQDYERGTLVGETTFGKGSVQQPMTLSGGQGALRVTIAHWYTPLERLIHGIGLIPDVVIGLTEEDAAADLDPQLQAAIDLLHGN